MRAFSEIRHRELPLLVVIVQPLEEPPLLLLLRHMQEKLQDDGAVARQMFFELIDILVAILPQGWAALRSGEFLSLEPLRMHTHHQHFFVVRTIEDADSTARRQESPV